MTGGTSKIHGERAAPSRERPFRRADVVAFCCLGLLWGSGFYFIKFSLEAGVGVIDLLAVRTVVGTCAAWVLVLLAERSPVGRRLPPILRQAGTPPPMSCMLVLGALSVVPFWLLVEGERFVSSGAASIISSTDPLWTLLILAVLHRTFDLRPMTWMGIAMGFAGVVVLSRSAVGANAMDEGTQGIIAITGSALLYSVLGVYAATACRSMSPLRVSAWGLTWGSLMLVVPYLASPAPGGVALGGWESAVFLGLGDTAIGCGLFYFLIGRVGPTRTAAVVYLMPLVALGLGVGVGAERLTMTMFIAMAMVLVGVSLTVRSGNRASAAGAGLGRVADMTVRARRLRAELRELEREIERLQQQDSDDVHHGIADPPIRTAFEVDEAA